MILFGTGRRLFEFEHGEREHVVVYTRVETAGQPSRPLPKSGRRR